MRSVRGGQFGQSEVEHLHRAVGPQLDIGGLQVAVDDALLVRGFESLGNLVRNPERLVNGDRAARDAIGKRLAFDFSESMCEAQELVGRQFSVERLAHSLEVSDPGLDRFV